MDSVSFLGGKPPTTPSATTLTGLVEWRVTTLKEILLTHIKAGEKFGKALDTALDVKRKTLHTRINKSAFELHYGREPNTEISNLLNLDALKKQQKRVFQETRYPTGVLIKRSWRCL